MIPVFLLQNCIKNADVTGDNTTVSNLKTDVPTETYKSNSNTCQIDIVLPAMTNLKGLAIVNHNCITAEMRHGTSFEDYQTINFDHHEAIITIQQDFTASHLRFILSSTENIEIGLFYLATKKIALPNRTQYPIKKIPARDINVYKADTGQKIRKTIALYWVVTFQLERVPVDEYLSLIENLYTDDSTILMLGNQKALQGSVTNTISSDETLNGESFQVHFEQKTFKRALLCLK